MASRPVSWPAYFKIRRAQRLRRTVLALTAAPAAFVAGTAVAANSLVIETSTLMMAPKMGDDLEFADGRGDGKAGPPAAHTILGLDPPLFYSLLALGAGAASAVAAPALCESVLRRVLIRPRSLRREVESLDADLRHRVQRYRCAPTDILAAAAAAGMPGSSSSIRALRSSDSHSAGAGARPRVGASAAAAAATTTTTAPTAAPAPDFYGEKIESIACYRSWLRAHRQAAVAATAAARLMEPAPRRGEEAPLAAARSF